MRKISFNKHWEFTFDNALDAYNNYGLQKFKEAYGAPEQFYKFNNWKKIDLPHDWAVALPFDLDILSFPELNQGCPNTFLGRGRSRAIRNIGQ